LRARFPQENRWHARCKIFGELPEEDVVRPIILRVVIVLALAIVAAHGTANATGIVDNFESYGLGTFPGPPWLDAGALDPQPPAATLPSAMVVATTDAFGNPTNALAVRDEVSLLSGVYYPVPVSSSYSLAADIRVDRFNNNPTYPATDFAMQLTFAQLSSNLYTAPQVGIYASTFTETWRLFLIPSDGGIGADIDLGLGITQGLWYRVQLDFDSIAGGWHARIADAGTGTTLVNQTGTFSDWTSASGLFDGVAFIEGEGSPDTTIGNLALVDNINVTATPEPASTGLLLASSIGIAIVRRGKRKRSTL
jgi:hypothetical protein